MLKTDDRVHLMCIECNKKFSRKRQPGRQPTKCKDCRDAEAKAKADKEMTLTCIECDGTFIYERQRGAQPVRCPECRNGPKRDVALEVANSRNADVVEAPYRERIAELLDKFGGPKRSIFLVPTDLLQAAQEDLRKAWCIAYGKPTGISERAAS